MALADLLATLDRKQAEMKLVTVRPRVSTMMSSAIVAIIACWFGSQSTRVIAQQVPRPAARSSSTPAAKPAVPPVADPRAPAATPRPKSPTASAAPTVTLSKQPAAPVSAKTPAVREIKVLVAGGSEYRTFYSDWQSRGRTIVEGASKHFEKEFGLRFQVVGFDAWEYKKAAKTADEAFRSLHSVKLGDADLVIGFTLVSFAGPRGEVRGLTQYFSQYVVIPDGWGVPGATTRLVHELSHVFGAFHVNEKNSVMLPGFEKTPRTFEFGRAMEETMPLTHDVNLKEGVGSLSPEAQQALRTIYRTHHHPLEAIDEDPVVVGYRYQSMRAELAGDTARSAKMKAELQRVKRISSAQEIEEHPAPGK